MRLVLSLFPGIDLLGSGFEAHGFCVVRGPDLLWGGDIRRFHPPRGVFEGIIGGPPCQDDSRARRSPPTGYGEKMHAEFVRVIEEASPAWYLHESVPGSKPLPDIACVGSVQFEQQRIVLSARDCGLTQRRSRIFTYGYLTDAIVIPRVTPVSGSSQPCCMATEGKKPGRRAWPDFCEAMGLPRDFDLPGWPIAFKYSAVGNGVPVPMAMMLAHAIQNSDNNSMVRLCQCGCGRQVEGKAVLANAGCRKRAQRIRDAARLGNPRSVTVTPRPPAMAGGSLARAQG